MGEATTITVERPTPENTKACNGAPSVNKYDWLLMLNVNELTRAMSVELIERVIIGAKPKDKNTQRKIISILNLSPIFYLTIQSALQRPFHPNQPLRK